jgi:putative adhesin
MLRGSRPAVIGCVVACAVIPSLAGCGSLRQIGSGAHSGPATTFTVTAPVTTLVVKGGTGSITVTGSGRKTILVSQRASFSKTPPATTHVVSGTTLTLGYTCPAQLVCGMAYDVQVPRGVGVRAATSAGSITLTSLAGPVTAQTNAGLISATGLSSRTADLKSNAGGINAAFTAAPGSVHASTNVGPITISVPGSASYQIQTRTYVGTSTVTVPKDAASPHTITASSDLGSITISPS